MTTTTRYVAALDKLIYEATLYRKAMAASAKWEELAERDFLLAVYDAHDACQHYSLMDYISDLTQSLEGDDQDGERPECWTCDWSDADKMRVFG